MLFEDKRSDVRSRRFAVIFENHAVDNREINIRIVLRDLLHDRRLRETDADDEVVTTFCKRAHRRLDRSWIARLYVTHNDVKRRLLISLLIQTWLAVGLVTSFGALHSDPGCRIEGTVILTANVEDNPDANFVRIVGAVTYAMASHTAYNK